MASHGPCSYYSVPGHNSLLPGLLQYLLEGSLFLTLNLIQPIRSLPGLPIACGVKFSIIITVLKTTRGLYPDLLPTLLLLLFSLFLYLTAP